MNSTMEFIIENEIIEKAKEWRQQQQINEAEKNQLKSNDDTFEEKKTEIEKTHILEFNHETSIPETKHMFKELPLTLGSKIGKYRIIAFKHIGDILKNIEKIANLLDKTSDVIAEAKDDIVLAATGVTYGIFKFLGVDILINSAVTLLINNLIDILIDTLFGSNGGEKNYSMENEKIKWISYIYIFTNPNITVDEFNKVFGSILNAILSIPEIPKILQSLIITFNQQDKIKLNKDFLKSILYVFYEKLALDGNKIRTLRDVDAFKYFKFRYFKNLNVGIGQTTSTTILQTLKALDEVNKKGKVQGIFCRLWAGLVGEETCPKLSAKPLYNGPTDENKAMELFALDGAHYYYSFQKLLRQILTDYFPAKIGLRDDIDKSAYIAIKQEELKLLQSGLTPEEQGKQLMQYFHDSDSDLDYDVSNLNWIIEILRLITVDGGLIDSNPDLFGRLLGFLSVIIDTLLDTLNDEVHRGGKKRKTKRRQKNRKSKKSKRKQRKTRKR